MCLAGSLAAIMLHLLVSYTLPYPLNHVNAIIGLVILSILWFDSGVVVWLSFVVFFFLEQFQSGPFGILIASGTFSTLILFWLYKELFTNRSLWSVLAMSGIGVLVYRVLYYVGLYMVNLASRVYIVPIDISSSFFLLFWELLFTIIFTAILFLASTLFSKKFNVRALKN